jgi:hypothetical protein
MQTAAMAVISALAEYREASDAFPQLSDEEKLNEELISALTVLQTLNLKATSLPTSTVLAVDVHAPAEAHHCIGQHL